MKILDAHLCDYAFCADNKMSLIGMFRHIDVLRLPAVAPPFYLCVEVETVKGEEPRLSARLRRPNGELLADLGYMTVIDSGKAEVNRGWVDLAVRDLELKAFGEHTVELLVADQVAYTFPVAVNPPSPPG